MSRTLYGSFEGLMVVRYENITKLITQLERSFESQGYANFAHTSTKRLTGIRFLWISGQSVLSRQRGVYRVNCIDCLDRTNVVQVSDIYCQSGLCVLTTDAVCICSICTEPAVTCCCPVIPFRTWAHGYGRCLQRWYLADSDDYPWC
jgi:hypothetical protein